MILHIKSTVNVLHLAVYYIKNLVKIQNVHRSITSKPDYNRTSTYCIRFLMLTPVLMPSCLSYIQVKTSYQEFSKNNQEQKQLLL